MFRMASKVALVLSSAAMVAAHADQTVKIGVAVPLSGPLGQQGKDVENGVKLAVENINAAKLKVNGEVLRIELVSEDDQADPKSAVTVAQKLVDAGVVGVVGHLTSGTSIPASKIYAEAGIPEVSPSATNPKFTRQGFANTFRTIGDDAYVGSVVAQYLVRAAKVPNVAIIDDRTAYGQGLADIVDEQVKKEGGKVLAREFATSNTVDFRGVLTSIKKRNAQVIFYGGVDAQAGPLRKQMSELGMNIPLVGSTLNTEQFLQLAGPASEGTITAESGLPIESMPGGKKFAAQFKKFGPIVMYAPYAYDAEWAIAKGMESANSTSPKVFVPAMKKISFPGVSGTISFDERGDMRSSSVTLYQVKGKKFNTLKTLRLK